MRIVGINIPDEKRVDISLSYIYGIGRSNVASVLSVAKIDPAKRTKDLTEDEFGRIQKALAKIVPHRE